ncbi:radial spoke head protein 3 homolog [Triplophysa dalaica]|uniref:radial spoke head protein 3 homolog n=1 Tax=Triplophysa dalaica TaxID=1582913 RepID=UPI0024DF4E77|nr:radial spoke head protein 3 homolog [Triplophysa dalaica]XP_056620663.1 radial spoke head protein 3 homolog [Triplophysa dalaica]
MASTLQTQHDTQGGVYTFSSRPRPVPNRAKYRNTAEPLNEEDGSHGNIMYDRRVVRGNTYAQHILPITSQPDPMEFLKQQEARRRAMSKKRLKEQFGTKTPEPLEGRTNIDVQTEMYLEELSGRIEEVSVECQTDMFLDKPATPLFIPAKTGRDAATQIEEGELFDFDVEVQPVLQVLVGKTIEQALLEVMEEEELDNLRARYQAFMEIRNAELVEVQRLEERERRLHVERENRIKQQKAVLEKEKETADKIAARAFAQQYLTDLLPSVYSNLKESGYFYDSVKRDLETGFLPWLMEEVSNTLEKRYVARTVVDQIIRDVTNRRLEAFQQQK